MLIQSSLVMQLGMNATNTVSVLAANREPWPIPDAGTSGAVLLKQKRARANM